MWTAIVSMQLRNKIKASKRKATISLSSLLREKGGDMLVFAFFLAVSFGFWLLQKLDDSFEAEITFPIELVNVPKGMIFTSALQSEVEATVQDRGTNLFNFMRNNDTETPIELDFSQYDNGFPTGKVTIPIADIQRAVQQQLLSSTQILRLNPSNIEVYYNRGVSKRLPVKFVGKVTTRTQNYLQDLTFSTDSVTVYAPASMLDTMQYAYTERQEINNLDRTSSFIATFPQISTIKFEPEEVQVTAHVDYLTEKTIQVPVVGLNFPAGYSLKTFPAQVTVKYIVGSANSKNIVPENFVLATTYEDLINNPSQKLRLKLKSIPLGVTNVRLYPQEVEYLLEYAASTPESSDKVNPSSTTKNK